MTRMFFPAFLMAVVAEDDGGDAAVGVALGNEPGDAGDPRIKSSVGDSAASSEIWP